MRNQNGQQLLNTSEAYSRTFEKEPGFQKREGQILIDVPLKSIGHQSHHKKCSLIGEKINNLKLRRTRGSHEGLGHQNVRKSAKDYHNSNIEMMHIVHGIYFELIPCTDYDTQIFYMLTA